MPSEGYGRDELEAAGAYRVYENPEDLLRHLDEVGVRPPDAGLGREAVPRVP